MSDERGVSDLIGYVLVFSLVASSVAIVSIAGLDSLENVRSVEQVNNAERAMDVLADNNEDLFREGAPSRASEITLEQASFGTADQVTINVSGVNGTGGLEFAVERQSNVLVWESQGGRDTQLRYAFGTVLRDQRDGGLVLREAPFEFSDERTILPIVQTRTRNPQSMGGGKIRVRGVRQVPIVIFRGNTGSFNDLFLNVTTTAPNIWQGYLDGQEGVACSIQSIPDPEKEKVFCDFETDELYVILQPLEVILER